MKTKFFLCLLLFILIFLNFTTSSARISKDEYQLSTLDELENYIKENKHLPDIPSASDIEENGILLSEIQGKFLKKIEELTLYVIQLKKDNESLKSRINKLEKRKATRK
ncbi:MAG: hypothetical protein A2X61_10500 [Ignavibacteria bacterium GWB2_35_12]|nr:MAG: hypothetical protein A2X61_10500 [Ignavibacteria bacterium GWB2_35_12]OGU92635.1 MAG: hypothetical protein A2220_03790 [Ignavibacteria bacterium RIFOXYA2_FULL_35_10]